MRDGDKVKREKFNFEKMRAAATHKDAVVRKKIFVEYFERFGEFPSYLFDNDTKIDETLLETMQDILKDPETPKPMQVGAEALLRRLPSASGF